jgi:hypothetical protein
MFFARALQVALLLACGVTAAHGKEPNVVIGAGASFTCKAYVTMLENHNSVRITEMIFSWVQGYFSARNTAGRGDHPLTVGGTMSADTLHAMLADECRNEANQPYPVVLAAEALYDKLQAKGL